MLFEASAPGSVMLMGEHAVLHNYPALVAAINRRIKAKLIPRQDDIINISAKNFGELELQWQSLKNISVNNKKLNYVLAAIKQFENKISSGFDLYIEADFSSELGLGSSAAVTVAVLNVLQQWLQQKISQDKLYKLGVKTIRLVQQGLGSGADVAASVYGGVIAYQLQPFNIEKLTVVPEIALVYTGYKTPTVEVIKHINRKAKSEPEYVEDLYRIIGDLTSQGIECFKKQDWQIVGQLFNAHFEAQRALGVSDKITEKIVQQLQNMPTVYGVKISGAGLGDCVIALGKVDKNKMQTIEVEVEKTGVNNATNCSGKKNIGRQIWRAAKK